jgi:mono/diheme cytochrome c family protein
MKKLLKVLVGLVAVLVLIVGAGVAYLFARYPDVPPPEEVKVAATPERLARGEYLARHVSQCVDCHAVRDFTKYAGPLVEGTEGRGGENFGNPTSAVKVLYSRNITPAAIGHWSDGEVIRAITSGVNRDGEALFPIMPYPRYARMAREDIEAIVAYVRTLRPQDYTPPPRELAMPLPLVVRTIPAAPQYRPIPPSSDRVAYGEYITNAAACADCHTPMDAQGTPLPGMDFAGGFEFPLPGGGLVRSANITPDADTGIGTWSEQQFVMRFKAFEHAPTRSLSREEQRENTMMPWFGYAGMTSEDLSAVYAYLRSIKPVVHRVRKYN